MQNTVMIIDSDDEPEPESEPTPAVEFEDADVEFDQTRPFLPIIQSIDVTFGIAATEIAVSTAVEGKIVFAATCADSNVRLVTLPLAPPGPEQKALPPKSGKYNETVQVLTGFSTAPDLVAITYQKSSEASSKFPGSLLIASHSREVTGLVLIHTVPIHSTTKEKVTSHALAPGHTTPSAIQYLSVPASSLDFNHEICTLLLGDKSGAVRLYCAKTSSWLLTLHTPFTSPTFSTPTGGHKAVLDAKWVLGNNAILVLLSDGEWGVWDLAGTGPGGPRSSKALLGPASIRGGALTSFTISGYIDGPPAKSMHGDKGLRQSKFAPMTPATRKTVDVSATVRHGLKGAETRGRISVVSLGRDKIEEKADERVGFWIGEAYAVIPSLRAYWEASRRRGGGLFATGTSSSRMQRVEGVNLRGEKCQGFELSAVSGDNEIVVLGEHRVVLVGGLPEARKAKIHKIARVPAEDTFERPVSSGSLDDLDRGMDELEERRSVSMGNSFRSSFGRSY